MPQNMEVEWRGQREMAERMREYTGRAIVEGRDRKTYKDNQPGGWMAYVTGGLEDKQMV